MSPILGPWPEGLIPKCDLESMPSNLEPEVDESLNPEDVAGSEPPSWAVGPDEVMTLGLSGEYLYAVKTEPPSLCTPNSTESTRDAIDCSHDDFPGDILIVLSAKKDLRSVEKTHEATR